MTKNEMYGAFVVIALIAYQMGLKKAIARTPLAPVDPMAWLYGYQSV